MTKRLTHLDDSGRARMVDVGDKPITHRTAVAEAWVRMSPEAFSAVCDRAVAKGDVLSIAELAGIQGAKRTADLIPLCHPLPVDSVRVEVEPMDGAIRIRATVSARWRTGVEMEALSAASAAALTVYDMTKAVDKGMVIDRVRLLEKRGGRSGDWVASNP
ncbi:MAG: cyclic pyranopterin monophosphate synthase MoaC [Myxococcota bacterium]|nr:cyclic pyranopterin monophosphate synthase MoaC [Myxococcota bacterium]